MEREPVCKWRDVISMPHVKAVSRMSFVEQRDSIYQFFAVLQLTVKATVTELSLKPEV